MKRNQGLKGRQIAAALRSAKEKAGKAVSCAAKINLARSSLEEEDEEVDTDLPPPTAPPQKLDDSGSTKRTRKRTLDFVLLHTSTASKKNKV